jgi:hypothetical protein
LTFVGSWGIVLIVIVEAGRHGNESRFCGGVDAGLFGALGYMAGLTQIKVIVLLNDVDAEEGFEIVGLGDCVVFLESVAKFCDQIVVAGRDGEIIDMDAEVDALTVWFDFEEEARTV